MKVYTTAPMEDPRDARTSFRRLEEIGYDGAFSFEAKLDPFLPLALAAERTTTLRLGTAIAIAFARNPMNLANLAHGLQCISGGRFVLGLGSQVRPHIEKRFSMPWSKPAARMRELVLAIKAIFACWEGQAKLDFRGEFYTHTLMTPVFNPGANPYGAPPLFVAGVGPKMVEIVGEVADGFFVHPFHSPEFLAADTLPALDRGLATAERTRANIQISCQTIVAIGNNDEEIQTARTKAKGQISFYGSTPAYRGVLDLHGYGDLQPELNRMSKEGKWLEMIGKIDDDLFDIARQLEEVALSDEYFIERKLYPNVDFYSGIIYRAMGIPTDMFTVMFALGRLPGWIAHWLEQRNAPGTRIIRPRQIYTGMTERAWVELDDR